MSKRKQVSLTKSPTYVLVGDPDLPKDYDARQETLDKRRAALYGLRRRRKDLVIRRASLQGIEAKSKLCIARKGHNGDSMNEALLQRHGIKREAIQ